jgi:putative membrane protein
LKRVAELLVNDHSESATRLSKLAERKGWPLPAPQQAPPPAAGTAAGTAASSFDARWTADMIAGHEQAVALYRAQARSGDDKELRQYASDTLPIIEPHLARLRNLQK